MFDKNKIGSKGQPLKRAKKEKTYPKLKKRLRSNESLEWWYDSIQQYQNNKTFDARQYNRMHRRFIKPGALIAFKYRAKGASKLPFWDKAPLTILFGETPRHFIGLNLHYVNPKARPTLMKMIIKINKLRVKNDRRFHLEWKDLKTFIARLNLQISIRKYIKGRMSSVVYVKGVDWKYAAALPSEKFVFNGSMDRSKLYQMILVSGRR